MRVEAELAEGKPGGDTQVTVGVFDGVHLGHRALITELSERAAAGGMLTVVVTFRQHPEDYFAPKRRLPFITDIEERSELLRDAGVDIIVPLSFTAEMAGIRARHFIELLQKYLRMRGLVIGPDFALGKGREGNIEYLQRLGEETGFRVSVVPPAKINGEVVSSTAIREALALGDIKKASRMLGRSFSLSGQIVGGSGRGAGLGFPTANLEVAEAQALPLDGVYASWSHIDDKVYQSMTNIGKCPTFGGNERTVETYLLDYEGDLYGREFKLEIIDRLRDEKRFASEAELKEQVAEDVARGRAILAAGGES